jgi:predicted O-methyltransferase YrrM
MKALSAKVAEEDYVFIQHQTNRRFSFGNRPFIRWIKGDGLDDEITRAAIGQATRLFGNEVDYCLCTQGINASRVRKVLEWASQPVEWWPVTEKDNPELASFLIDADCPPENFGYWWKWFPERVRPDAPEWILDGDMIITGKPDWFQQWLDGKDFVRLSQVDNETPSIYGKYSPYVDTGLMLYSGLASLPPKCRYMPLIAEVLKQQPLPAGHNGKKDMDEQGIIVAAFEKLSAVPIPLYEFPFCRAYQPFIDFGLKGDQNLIWGYHFGNSFIMRNPQFENLSREGKVFSLAESSLPEKFKWLGNYGQWGIPGWSMSDHSTKIILQYAAFYTGKEVLELGTSRGRLSAMLATLGCKVTTLDHVDRGAAENLSGLSVNVVVDDSIHFLETTNSFFDLVVCDMHGNAPDDWKKYSKPLVKLVKNGSTLIINNYLLNKIPEWHEETGVEWFLKKIPRKWTVKLHDEILPGIAVVSKEEKNKNNYGKIITDFAISLLNKFIGFKGLTIYRFYPRQSEISGHIRMIRQSGLFDENYYLDSNPDVKFSGMNPVRHYLLHGGFESRKPCLKFDSGFYLNQNPDVKDSGMNPLLHFILFGKTEGRSISSESPKEEIQKNGK